MALTKNLLTGTVLAGATAGAILAAASVMRNKSQLDVFGNSLYFPEDLGTDAHPHYISFSFQEYERRSIFQRGFLKDSGMIRLPMPGAMVNAADVQWDQNSSGMITGAILENTIGAGKATESAITAGLAASASGLMSAGAGSLLRGVLGSNGAPGGMRDQIMQLGGVAQNPFLTILFKSPTFKRHSFSWAFNPENAKEVETIRNIINKFNYHQLPDLSGYSAGTLMTYPDIVLIGYYPDDKYLYKFKPCVIESIASNYTPEGQPTFFNSVDAPTSYELRINLLEIELWFKPDVLIAQGLLNDTYRTPSPISVDELTKNKNPEFTIPPNAWSQ